jgi:outer membrane receptor protein involved in Fe transport
MRPKYSNHAALKTGTASFVLALTLSIGSPAFAQNAAGQNEAQQKAAAGAVTPPAAEPEANTEVVITGSRIIAPNMVSAVPITSVSGDQFFKTGEVSVGDKLNELPSIRSTFSTQNSTQFLGTAGLNLLDLRGLGTQRTLVLVNGRRHVGGDILNNAVSTDINTIPTDLIDRIDIVTGGQSGVYGSDAIAGVVNFVLKDHYDGVQMRAQSGISKYGDAGAYYGSILAGRNFAEGRGNVAVNLEYAHQSDYYGSERPVRNTNAFIVVDTDPSGSVNGSDGVPDRVFLRDVRSSTISNGGLVSFASPTGACGRASNGAAFNCVFQFQPDGTLVPQTGQRVGVAPNGSFLGGNGTNLREGHQLVLQPRQDRYTGNLVGHYEITPALVPFVEATFAHVVTTGSTSGPAFFQGSTLDANLERPRLDNPFLSDQARSLITQQLIASGTDPASITGATQFQLKKNLLDLGVRNEASKRNTFRIVGGLKGDLGSGWRYELSGNYGQFKESTRIEGNLNVQRFLLAMDSTRNASGQIVCRSQIDPTAGAAAEIVDDPAVLASDISSCVPLNPFGLGSISPAARNYVIQDTTSHGKITQTVVNGFISGDSGKWFELPGGPISVVLGGEYRRETNSFTADSLVEAGYTFYNALPTFKPPSFAVKEAYGELRLPLLKDIPFIRELTLSGSGRVSDYKGSAGTVYAYNGDVVWRPINDLQLRGGYSRSVRAPNLVELYSAQSQNFAPNFVDPCSARNIATGTANRAANCAAAGIPASYDFAYTQSLEIVSGGNPKLKAETSDSWTLGGVYTPHFLPGLSVSVDYYNITVNKVIAAVDAQTIADQCYDSPSLSNPFCSLFQRAGPGGGPKGEIEHQILEGSLLQSTLNFAKLKARGIDVDVAYRHNFGRVQLTSHGIYTHVLQRSDYLDPTNPNFEDRVLGELGDPKDNFNWTTDVKVGKITGSYEMRFISHMYLTGSEAENYESVNGLPPQNTDYADRRRYPSVFYHNIRVMLDVNDRFSIYAGVDNLTNRLPPFGLTGVTDGGGIYDARGRFMYTGVIAKF